MAATVRAVIDNDEAVPSGLTDTEIQSRIMRWINDPPRNSRVITITPIVAAWILETFNKKNRSTKPNAIARFTRHMTANTWGVTGDNLKFSDAKLLRDGQNRLRACVRSGRPFTTHVVFGIRDDLFDRMDQNTVRSGADVLTIAGFPNSTVLQSAVRHVHNLLSDNPGRRDGIEADEALRLIREQYPTLPDYVVAARAVRATTQQPMGLVTALLYVFHLRNRAKAEDFAAAWADGRHAGKFAAIGKMERALSKLRSDAMGRVHDQVRCALIIISWNIFLNGHKGSMTRMVWRPGDQFPEITR